MSDEVKEITFIKIEENEPNDLSDLLEDVDSADTIGPDESSDISPVISRKDVKQLLNCKVDESKPKREKLVKQLKSLKTFYISTLVGNLFVMTHLDVNSNFDESKKYLKERINYFIRNGIDRDDLFNYLVEEIPKTVDVMDDKKELFI